MNFRLHMDRKRSLSFVVHDQLNPNGPNARGCHKLGRGRVPHTVLFLMIPGNLPEINSEATVAASSRFVVLILTALLTSSVCEVN